MHSAPAHEPSASTAEPRRLEWQRPMPSLGRRHSRLGQFGPAAFPANGPVLSCPGSFPFMPLSIRLLG